MLLQRILTALILLPVALGGFFLLDGGAFALFIGAVVTLGAWEWGRLAGFSGQGPRVLYAGGVALALWLLYGLGDRLGLIGGVPLSAAVLLVLALGWWLVASALVMTFPASAARWNGRLSRLLIGLLILLPAWQGLVLLKQWPLANWLIITVMVLVWAADIGAYFSGKAFGRRKLAPRVSPGKSWEGFFGGMALSLLLTLGLGLYRGWPTSQLLLALVAAAVVVAFSVIGDLTESMFKRQAGIKDSSNLLPGHGGVLDRIDSLTAAIPLFALLLLWAAGRVAW
jgi:phosphatidate cytidylyltransferase